MMWLMQLFVKAAAAFKTRNRKGQLSCTDRSILLDVRTVIISELIPIWLPEPTVC